MDLSEINRAIRSGLKTLEAAAPLRLSEWAARHFYLSAESSYVEQAWSAYPYQVAILDCIGHDDIAEVTFRKSARVGYTKMILAAIAYYAEHKRRNQAVWQPTDEDSDEFVKTELEPMIRDVPVIAAVFPSFLQRNKNNTLRQKLFLGSILHLRGGKAAKNFRRLSVDAAFVDEIDAFDLDVEGEGSPVELARKRIEGATFPKLVAGSTPKLKGFSQIEAREAQSEKRYRYFVPCPYCDLEHPLEWGGKDKPNGFKWTGDDADSVVHVCPHCRTAYAQADYLRQWTRGRWIAQDGSWIGDESRFYAATGEQISTPHSVAFHIWTAYSPHTDWPLIVRQFLSAVRKASTGDKSELKTFVNTTLGETWEAEVERSDEHELRRRAEDLPLRTVPVGGLVLAAGVDVQDNRFEVVVWAIGRGEEMWTVDHMVIGANPADERDWERLEGYLTSKFSHTAGGKLGIEAAAIDTGGHFTHQAYNFCRLQAGRGRRVYAVKGETKHGMPVKGRSSLQDVNWRGKIIKGGVKLWHVGTDTAKDLLHGRLKVTQPGPGYVHLSKHLPDAFFEQLTAEARVLQKTSQGEVYRWIKTKTRNEALDCTVYALFAAHARDLHRYTDRMWERLEAAVQPPTSDMFSAGQDAVADPVVDPTSIPINQPQPAAIKRRGGFVNSWRS